MENDEVSGKITVDGGFYFIKCLNKYNQELTEANKANIVDKREKEAFDDEYNGFVSSLSSNINEELWENLELETGSGMKTDTFFEVFNTYCGVCDITSNFFEGKDMTKDMTNGSPMKLILGFPYHFCLDFYFSSFTI